MTRTNEIHISDVRTFRACRRRWDWASGMRQNLERIIPYAPFFTGKAIHAALEFHYQDSTTFESTLDKYLEREWANVESLGTLWPAEINVLEEQIDLIYKLLNHYRLWVAWDTRNYSDANLEFLHMEYPFEVEMPGLDGVKVGGRFDGIVKHRKTDKIWVFETKTARSIQQLIATLTLDEQCTLYTWAAKQAFGEDVEGVLYNVLRKKAPATPSYLQSGLFSKNKAIDTTHLHFRSCIQEDFPGWFEETIEEEYGEVLQALVPNEQKFFMRFPVKRSEVEIEMMLQGLRSTAVEMLNPQISIYPAPSFMTCNFCTFKSPCIAMNQGSNYKVLLDAEFQPRESATSMRPDKEDEDVGEV